MARINAYLRFNGKCREAMEFYKSCLGGKLEIQTVGESPMAAQMPAATYKSVMHSELSSSNLSIMAADNMVPEALVKGNTVVLALITDTVDELKTLFTKLSEGGKVKQPLEATFFGTYGEVTDRFGVDWMFQSDAKETSKTGVSIQR